MHRNVIILTFTLMCFISGQKAFCAHSDASTATINTLKVSYISVPRDSRNITSETKIPIAYAVRLANQPHKKIGSLWINYGGPGVSAIEQLKAQLQSKLIPIEILNRFDLVAFDPRGTGKSAFANAFNQCEAHKSCAIVEQKYAPYMGTNYVAHDMEYLRQHLGMQDINLLGYSYGTRLFSVYHYYYRQNVRAVILDGMDSLNSNQLKANLTKAITIQTLIDAKLDQMNNLTTQFPLFHSINTVSNAFDDNSIHFSLSHEKKLSAEASQSLINLIFYDVSTRSKQKPNQTLPIINCNDQHRMYTKKDIDDLARHLDDFKKTAFHSLAKPCLLSNVLALNPIPAEDLISESFRNKAISPLIVSSEYDFSTPYLWSQQAQKNFNADLITMYHGTEHGLTFSGYSCVNEQVIAYLTELSPSEYDCNAETMTELIMKESEQEILELITNPANYL